jgi:hypothetical protein
MPQTTNNKQHSLCKNNKHKLNKLKVKAYSQRQNLHWSAPTARETHVHIAAVSAHAKKCVTLIEEKWHGRGAIISRASEQASKQRKSSRRLNQACNQRKKGCVDHCRGHTRRERARGGEHERVRATTLRSRPASGGASLFCFMVNMRPEPQTSVSSAQDKIP